MSLDVYLERVMPCEVFSCNTTHNLQPMAREAGLHAALWEPETIGVTVAAQLTTLLEEGLAKLHAEPERFRAFNAPNGWGRYEDLVRFTERYLAACREHPDATIRVRR